MINQTKRRYLLKRENVTTISQVDSFHGSFRVLSTLLTQFMLKICNCSHRRHCESMVHIGSMMEIIILVNSFIVFHSTLIQGEYFSLYVESGRYHTNTRSFFSIVEQDYNTVNEITEIILSDQLCNIEKCSSCKNTKFFSVTNLGSLLDLRTSKISKELKKQVLQWVI